MLKKDAIELVKWCGENLKYIKSEFSNDKEVVMAAVKADGAALSYVNNSFKNDKDVVLAAIKSDCFSFKFVSDELMCDKEVVMAAVSKDGDLIVFVKNNLRLDKEVVLTALNNSPYTYRNCDVLIQRDLGVIKFVDGKLKLLGESIEDYLCDELIDLKEKYGVDTLVLALEMEAAEIERDKLSSNAVNVGVVSGINKRF